MGDVHKHYAEQLARVRSMAVDGFEGGIYDDDVTALQAVLAHYDAYAVVVDAASDYASYDDLTVPVEDLTAPDHPDFINAVRLALHHALAEVDDLAQSDAQGIV